MEESFAVKLSDRTLNILPVREKDTIIAYQLSVDGKYLGEIYPDHGNAEEGFLVWRSYDPLDPYIVALIGKEIELHDL